MKPTSSDTVKIKSFKKIDEDMIISRVTLLGQSEPLYFTRDGKAMTIYLKNKIKTDLPICFKLEIG